MTTAEQPSEHFAFDPRNEVHARAIARLSREEIAWIGSVGGDGTPHAVPVWFLWRDGRVLILSQPNTAKVRNLRRNDKALVHLEAGDDGEQLLVLRGTARLSPTPAGDWIAEIGREYSEKYADGLVREKLTMESMAASYSVVIEFLPKRLIAW
ncbi:MULTISPECIES: pyridoxamine 5'-phosphate oxidase family protein [unclassified Leifsonia]|uniref:pyridoxamine 5'-phosphate oxidase family protein n=1 Tax=unclassified Leifsonia TaxID=2663824 RepID=UPI0006F335EC|nr:MULTISPECIES: pyridoxamine 5'-phosphate oxidase family protein [unclassified Leifsonia]KQX08149.1 hypothetical protein ASC59_10785 [Leifsonia sp. Root1293]KRA12430.1 hypothetical protein ASD61_10785 [Leifsonia sp. Root60]